MPSKVLIKKKKKKIKPKKKTVCSSSVISPRGNGDGQKAGCSRSIPNALKNISQNNESKKTISLRNEFKTRTSNVIRVPRLERSMPYKNSSLNPKDRNFIISTCQAKSIRYRDLKIKAIKAIRQNKVFTIHGCCPALRKALLERDWVEKMPPFRMNVSKIRDQQNLPSSGSLKDGLSEIERMYLSSLVEHHNPNFIWRTRDNNRGNLTVDMSKEIKTIYNKLRYEGSWTTKEGLSSSLKYNNWFFIEDVADVDAPRTYSTFDGGEFNDFINDYHMTACTSLLKWTLSMVANDRLIFTKTGTVPIGAIKFAIDQCKEFLYCKQNRDIDRNSDQKATTGHWRGFLKHYYRIVSRKDTFRVDAKHNKKIKLYLALGKYLLYRIHKYKPQLSCEGCFNIWIIKPAHCSRGRGIKIASKLGVIRNLLTNNTNYVIQKYIEEPLLIHETKFDIRQYYLVTSTHPLIIWMYKDSYLKFSSQIYDLKNFHESIHLTNYAVQKNYKNCSQRHPELPPHNMWDVTRFKEYLNDIGREQVWDNIIYPGMRKTIIGSMISCQDSMTISNAKNRFELYGCDFILDKAYKPWLIEINSNPDLNKTTSVTAKICPAVIADIIKVVIDHAGNSKASTGRFECIYRQPYTIPRYGIGSEMFVQGYAVSPNYFYTGTIEINESYSDADIEKEEDVDKIIKQLNAKYDKDIMVEPDDNDLDRHIIKSSNNYQAYLENLIKDLDNRHLEMEALTESEKQNLINVIKSAVSQLDNCMRKDKEDCNAQNYLSNDVSKITSKSNDRVCITMSKLSIQSDCSNPRTDESYHLFDSIMERSIPNSASLGVSSLKNYQGTFQSNVDSDKRSSSSKDDYSSNKLRYSKVTSETPSADSVELYTVKLSPKISREKINLDKNSCTKCSDELLSGTNNRKANPLPEFPEEHIVKFYDTLFYKTSNTDKAVVHDIVSKATKNIISFLNMREREYINENNKINY